MNHLDLLWHKYFEWVDDKTFKDKETGEEFNVIDNNTINSDTKIQLQ